jgi:hypothetical protein
MGFWSTYMEKIWEELEEMRTRNVKQHKDELDADIDKRIIVGRLKQAQRDIVLLAHLMQRVVNPYR